LIGFRRTLYGENLDKWKKLKMMVDEVQQTLDEDKVRWKIGSSGQFRVKDLYVQLRAKGSFPQKFLWKTKIPMKVKIFLWITLKIASLPRTIFSGEADW
jgi:hypothetical protein